MTGVPPRRATVVALAAWLVVALAAKETTAGKDDVPPPPKPDFPFYVRNVAPFLEEKCVSCHKDGAGGFTVGARVTGKSVVDLRRDDFERVSKYVDRDAPWRSRLILKILEESQGGLPHSGGALLGKDDDTYDDLLDFASGATLRNLPPEPFPGRDRRIEIGKEVLLDGSTSYDRDQDPLQFRWDLYVRPPGSTSALVDDHESKSKFTPDVAGTYVARLRVSDGKVWSAPYPVVLEALDRVALAPPDAAAPTGLDAVDPAALRLVRALHLDLLGRPPSPGEAIALAGKPAKEVASVMLKTLEAGRAWFEDACLRFDLVDDFQPALEETQQLPVRLAGGADSPAKAEAALVRDPSFLRAHPTGAALVDAVFGTLLERAPKAEERLALLAACVGKPSNVFGAAGVASARDVLGAVLASPEFEAAALRRFVARFLPPDAAVKIPSTRGAESTVALAADLVSSADYLANVAVGRPKTDAEFVRGAYVDLFGRRPTAPELSALVRAAGILPGTGAPRAAIVKILIDSGEAPFPLLVDVKDPDAWVADRFLRYLGRKPTAAEARAYHGAWMDPAGGPDVIVRAILTGTEYASR